MRLLLPLLVLGFLIVSASVSAQKDRLLETYSDAICEKVTSGAYPLSGDMGAQFLVLRLVLSEAKSRNPELFEGKIEGMFPGHDFFESSIIGNELCGEIIRKCPEVGAKIAVLTRNDLEKETYDSKAGLMTFKREMNRSEWLDLISAVGKKSLKAIAKDKKRTLKESVFFHLDQSKGREQFYNISTNGRLDFVEIFVGLVADKHPELAARYYTEKQLYSFGFSSAAEKRMEPVDEFIVEAVSTGLRNQSETIYGPCSEIVKEVFGGLITKESIGELSEKLRLSFTLDEMALREYLSFKAPEIIAYYGSNMGREKGFLQPYVIQRKLSFGPPVSKGQVGVVNTLANNYCTHLASRSSRRVSEKQYIKQVWSKIAAAFPVRARNDRETFENSISDLLPSSLSSCN